MQPLMVHKDNVQCVLSSCFVSKEWLCSLQWFIRASYNVFYLAALFQKSGCAAFIS